MLQLQDNIFFTSVNTKESLENKNDLNGSIFKEIFYYNVYTKLPNMAIKPGNIVLDVGAHIGIFSRYSAVCGAEKVIAFEMNPIYFSCLKQNVRKQDDVFNCVVLNKNLSKFKLENDILINGFDLNHFYDGGLFNRVDFIKIDVMGKEMDLILSIHKNVYDIINKISVKTYGTIDKTMLVKFMEKNGFVNHHNLKISNCSIEFIYFWK
jgi:predicted RNA methylase